MNVKNFTLLEAISKSSTFSTNEVDVQRDIYLALSMVTASESSLNVSAQLEVSIDNTNWAALGSPTVITSNTTSLFAIADNPYAFARITTTFTAGSATFTVDVQTKGY